MTQGPLDRLKDLLPADVSGVVRRDTAIPSIALAAARIKAEDPGLVRADIGQIVGVNPDREVLYGPPVGIEPLRQMIAATWNRVFDLELEAQNVAITTGAAEALTLLLRCFADGAKVGIPRGYWENYVNAVELAGGEAVLVDYFDEQGALDCAGLQRQIEAEGIAVLLTNFPANPTGAVLTPSENRALARTTREADVVVVADEVYARLRYDGGPPLTLMADAPERTIAVGSASKEYLLPGARVGFVVSDRAELTDQVLRKLTRANTASPNVPGQQRLLELMRSDLEDIEAGREPQILGEITSEMRRRRDRLVEILLQHEFTLAGRPNCRPEGAIFLMAGLPGWWSGADDEAFAASSLEHHCVSVIPGSSFGLPGTIRFSFGSMTLEEMERLDSNLASFRGKFTK